MEEGKGKVPFVSCIKVKGIQLLPPLITQNRRVELQGYKQQAVKLEKRLKSCKDLKKNLSDLLNLQPLTNRPHSEVSFRSDGHIESLGIIDKVNDYRISSINKAKRKIKLSKDIIDVTQYDSDGIKIIFNESNSSISDQSLPLSENNSSQNTDKDILCVNSSQMEVLHQFRGKQQDFTDRDGLLYSMELDNYDSNTTSQNTDHLENLSMKSISPNLEKSPKPRLIRSNSYTLDTPSPILLAHLEKNGKSYDNNIKKLDDMKHLSISRNWSSMENNYVPFENSEFSSLNTVYNVNLNESEDNLPSSTSIDNKENNVFQTRSSSPAIKVIQTDISVQKITVNANNDIIDEALDENDLTSDSQLLKVLKTLPDVYATQIIELIESQKKQGKQKTAGGTEELNKNYDKDNNEILKLDNNHTIVNHSNDNISESLNTSPKTECQINTQPRSPAFSVNEKLQGSTTSISPSQSIYYSVTSNDTLRPMSNSSVQFIDFECEDGVTFDEKCNYPKKTEIIEYYVHDQVKKGIHNVSRELFPQLDLTTNGNIKQEWAASVIGAHVKGYLTRRLLKTERVQSLIETIKDALLCALQLHNAENIDESDVELHRRLINQVSAACYTFHDIFFSLSTQEQMSIIATDRQRKLEKAKRPSSAPSARRSKSSSNRSMPRQRLSSHSQSLTKV